MSNITNQKLKWFCVKCHHYVTDHVPEGIVEEASQKGFNISPYVGVCNKCECSDFEMDDAPPSDKDAVAFVKDYNKLVKDLGLWKARLSKANEKLGIKELADN
tara:strand:- start:519 stop:827 length:309 start_codon:yes stop_codon:yes gene_type:complete